MRLKYQLRGLGIGIIITAALLMGFSDKESTSAEENEVMVEKQVTESNEIEVAEVVTESSEEIISEDVTETIEETISQEDITATQEEQSLTEEIIATVEKEESVVTEEKEVENISTEEEKTEVEEIETEESSVVGTFDKEDVVEIKIVSGDGSGTVARKLQTAGLVENAKEYDAYLMQHGYDKKISVGTIEIEKGSSWLEIAEKISGK